MFLSTKEDVTHHVAHTVKRLRHDAGLSLRALAEASGVSPSMISDIERASKSPTVATLSALAEALGVPISALVEPPRPSGGLTIVRHNEHTILTEPSGIRRETLTPLVADSSVEFLRFVLPAGATAGPFAAHGPGTIERLVVDSGTVRATFGGQTAMLGAGDSGTATAGCSHQFENVGGEEAVLYLVIERGQAKA